MILLKYNTASQEIPLGYFLDSTDGNTEETGLTIANTDIKLWKAGATTLANKNSGGATHISNGIYYATLDATDTNTYGPMTIFVHVSGALACKVDCWVINSNVYNAFFADASGFIRANTVQLSGDATAADNCEAFFDGTGYAGTNNTIPTVTTVTNDVGVNEWNGVALATTNPLPNAAAGAAGGLPTDSTGKTSFNDVTTAQVNTEVDTALADIGLDHLINSALPTSWAADVASGSVFDNIADDGTATYDRATDSLQAVRDRGDVAWVTGGGGGLTQSINPILAVPPVIDLSNTATVRIGIILTNTLDDLPTTAEITPGTITIARKAQGGTSWSNVVSAAAMSEQDGLVYYDEVFDSGSGYAVGDMIRIQFESVSVTADANTYNITGATGVYVYSYVVEPMRGTDAAATATALATAQTDLDTLTGSDGVTLATSQPNYAPNTTTPPTAAAIADAVWDESTAGHTTAGTFGEQVKTDIDAILADTNELQTDDVPGLIAALNNISSADVNAQVLDVLQTDTFAELASVPGATSSLKDKITWLFMLARNQLEQTATTTTVRADDTTTSVATSTVSDDGTTATRGEFS